MAKNTKGKTVGTHLSFEIAEEIEKRAKAMGWSVSKYIGYILQDWHARGCPPINSIEESIRGAEVKKTSKAKRA